MWPFLILDHEWRRQVSSTVALPRGDVSSPDEGLLPVEARGGQPHLYPFSSIKFYWLTATAPPPCVACGYVRAARADPSDCGGGPGVRAVPESEACVRVHVRPVQDTSTDPRAEILAGPLPSREVWSVARPKAPGSRTAVSSVINAMGHQLRNCYRLIISCAT